ncbi:MAG: MBL fold metallo-hydrolase [Planctomycetaceae bacterium]|nr:MAG: MBL fold metallo-hydrolase [Planctomycetaceae bacterium]
MLARRPLFPGVIELNHQAGWRIGCNVYLVYADRSWALVDIGYSENVDEIIEMIRQMDFPLSQCRALIATHADVDHIQGLSKAKTILKAPVIAHVKAVEALESGDRIKTFAEISAQGIHLDMPPIKVDRTVVDGDTIDVGSLQLQVWHTPGHTDSQLAFRVDNLLLSGDNIYRDGSVGAIDAHHGSDIPSFIRSLEKIAASDVTWLLPSHGPIFRKDDALLAATILRLRGYLQLADFGTCAPEWPLMAQWDKELAEGRMPDELRIPQSLKRS